MPINADAIYRRYNCPLLPLGLDRFLLSLMLILLGANGQISVNDKAKSVLKDPNQIPPNIYQWIEQNAHICTRIPLNDTNTINFLNAVEGARCSLCPEPRVGEAPKVACAVEVHPNTVEVDIGCHSIPELCVLDLRERYAEFFASGGKMPKLPQLMEDALLLDAGNDTTNAEEEIFSTTGDPFLIVSEQAPSNFTSVEETTTAQTDQLTLNAESNASTSINEFFPKNELRQFSKRPDEDTFESLTREFALIPPPFKRGSSIRTQKQPMEVEDGKNADDRDQKAAICLDTHELCCFWAHANECDHNPFWMRINCAKTCGTCNCKVQHANNCVSTGIQCQTTTVFSTLIFSTKTSMTSTSTSIMPSTLQMPTAKTRIRKLLSTRRTRLRGTRPRGSSGNNINSQPPGHRPQRPPYGRSFPTPPTTASTLSEKPSSTTPSTTFAQVTPSTTRSTCFNYNRICTFWAQMGECERNPFWMRPHCQKACNSCGETVKDVLVPPRKPECENHHSYCPFWAFIGECSANARWMSSHCRASCQLC